MKSFLILSLTVFSMNVYSETKAVKEVLPQSAQIHKLHRSKKVVEAPCDTKEDVLKKLEEQKKASAESGKGFSLQGKTDTGCTIK